MEKLKEFLKSFGGAAWAAILTLSVVATIAVSFGLPNWFTTENPWVMLSIDAAVFAVAFFNGWKQREFRALLEIKDLAKDHEKAIRSKDVELEKLAGELKRLRYDYDCLVEANDGDPVHDALCQSILDTLKKLEGNQSQIEQYVREKLNEGVVQRYDFGRAFNDLVKYRCISGGLLEVDESGAYCLRGEWSDRVLLRDRFPSHMNRTVLDSKAETEAMVRKTMEENSGIPIVRFGDEMDAAKIGATLEEFDGLSKKAQRILSEMSGDDARCFRFLCSVSTIENGKPDRPLIVLPSPPNYIELGVTDECVAHLVEAGVFTKHDPVRKVNMGRFYRQWDHPLPEGYKGPYFTDFSDLERGEKVTTRSAQGEFQHAIHHEGDDNIKWYPDSPLRFTTHGSELAAICKVEHVDNPIDMFNEAWTQWHRRLVGGIVL